MTIDKIIEIPEGIQEIKDKQINIVTDSNLFESLNSFEDKLREEKEEFINNINDLIRQEIKEDESLYKKRKEKTIKLSEDKYIVNVALIARDYYKSKKSIPFFIKKIDEFNKIIETPYSLIKNYSEWKSLVAIKNVFERYGILPELDYVFDEYKLYQKIGIKEPESIEFIYRDVRYYPSIFPKFEIKEIPFNYITHKKVDNFDKDNKIDSYDNDRETLTVTTSNYKLSFIGFFISKDAKNIIINKNYNNRKGIRYNKRYNNINYMNKINHNEYILNYLFVVETELPNEIIGNVVRSNIDEDLTLEMNKKFKDPLNIGNRLNENESINYVNISELVDYLMENYPYRLKHQKKTTIIPSTYAIILTLIEKEYGEKILDKTIEEMYKKYKRQKY